MKTRQWINSFTLIALLLGGLLFASEAYSFERPNPHHGPQKGPRGFEAMLIRKTHMLIQHAEELGLTDEQVTKIEDLMGETLKNVVMKNAEMKVVGIEIFKQLKQDNIDVAQVNELIAKKSVIEKEKGQLLVRTVAEVKSTLTNEQKQKIKTLIRQAIKPENHPGQPGREGRFNRPHPEMFSLEDSEF